METTTKSEKRNKIIYWIFTIWMSLGMVSTGIVQTFHIEEGLKGIAPLGYPMYFLTILGVWKMLGVAAILIPGFLLIKEWAYAGFFFTMTGAVISHLAHGSAFGEIFPSILLLVLVLISWYFRPSNRKIAVTNIKTYL